MLEKGLSLSACAGFVYVILSIFYRLGWHGWRVPDSDVIVTLVTSFLAGCLSGFFAWDRLIEQYKENSEAAQASRLEHAAAPPVR